MYHVSSRSVVKAIKIMGKMLSFFSTVVVLLVAFSLFFPLRRGLTTPIHDAKGNLLPSSIASLETVEIGGMSQWVLIRGSNTANPVLLWLHGGPGAAQMPVAHYFNGALENDFVVVHWDQRGAGKSNPPDFDERTMTFEQFISDAHEMTQYLKARFHQDKIYLVGHSWGSQLGLKLAQAYPQDYFAYIGVSQVIDAQLACQIGYTWLSEQVSQASNHKDLQRLQKLGPPPYSDHKKFVRYVQMIDAYGGGVDVGIGELAGVTLRSPEYRISDILAYLRGANRGSGPMWDDPEYQSFNALKDIPQLLIPVYFFTGKRDYNTPLEVTELYFGQLDAPAGKTLVIFEDSAHTPFLKEPEKFNRELRRVKVETLN